MVWIFSKRENTRETSKLSSMGEEEKKPAEEKKMEEKDGEESKEETKEETPPSPPPQEIVLKVYMHCEGCARKVRRCLKGFQGVEDVMTDWKSDKVVVKGEKADPLKVLERVQRKSHRRVELLSPVPKPPAPEEKKPEEKDKPKPEEKKEEVPITVVLKVHMHCEACAHEIKKRIQRMKGVESAETDLKSSEVTVNGVFEPPELEAYVNKRTGKHAVVMKQVPPDASKDDGGKEKTDEQKGEEKEHKKDGGDQSTEEAKAAVVEEAPVAAEVKKNEYNYYPPMHGTELYPYPPQMFSDENPNACSVM